MAEPPVLSSTFFRHLHALHLALLFLTRLPLGPVRATLTDADHQRAVLYYPLAGAVIGLVLALAAWLLAPAGSLLATALVLALWVWITGALHIDGLADCIDSLFAGHKETAPEARRVRILNVMQDPHVGSVAQAALVVLLLVKFAALTQWLGLTQSFWLLLLIPMLARALAVAFMDCLPYVRREGLVPATDQHQIQMRWAVALVAAAVTVILLPAAVALTALIALVILFWYWRHLWQLNLGGYTGDCLGALVEIAETLLLVVFAVLLA